MERLICSLGLLIFLLNSTSFADIGDQPGDVKLRVGDKGHSPGISAHTSKIDITPPLEMKYTLGGYGERMNKPAESIHDRIFAKAIVFKNGEKKYAIITLDILALPSNVKSDLTRRLSGSGWGMNNIMLLPSHSHGSLEMAALNSKNLLNNPQIGIFQPELLEFLLNKLALLFKDADHDYQPVKIGTGSKIIEGLNRNRRKDPEIDNEMTVTRVDLMDGKPMAVLVNWTAHPTFLDSEDMMVSAEWPGYLQNELEKQIGNNVTVMYYNGAEGDQSPVFDANMNRYEKAEAYGRIMAQKSLELYREIRPFKVKEFYSTYTTIKLPEQKAHPSFMKTGGTEYGLDENSVKIAIKMLAPDETGLGALKIGDLIIAGVPGEMTAVLGLKLKAAMKSYGVRYTVIGGLADEWISYILSQDQYLNGEGYESSVSFYGPGLGDLLSAEILKNLYPLTKLK
jgi:Neutral/alkaline non-lysosomal ceramidase, N-terminal